MRGIDRTIARDAIRATLAADAGCEPSAFGGDGITVVEWREMPGRRRFASPARPFLAVTLGRGLVVSCHRDWLGWARERAPALDRFRFFAPANLAAIVALLVDANLELAGPYPSYGCSVDTFRTPTAPPHGVALDVVEGEAIDALRPLGAFRNALSPEPLPARPDMVGVTASAGGEVVACAAASADSAWLWQVGVDVLPAWKGRGLGRAVVARLTEAVLDAGKVPYYSFSPSNMPSAALATSLGYWPAWVQLYAREHR